MALYRRLALTFILSGVLVGCENTGDRPTTAVATNLFAPKAMRINPVFSQVADLTHAGHTNGVEVQLEFTDEFDDPTKASGRVLFELFEYRRDVDPRGKRVAGPWVFSIQTVSEQKAGWNPTLRSYRFALINPDIKADESYVLSAVFELSGGGRFFDKIALAGRTPESTKGSFLGQEQPLAKPATRPTTDVR